MKNFNHFTIKSGFFIFFGDLLPIYAFYNAMFIGVIGGGKVAYILVAMQCSKLFFDLPSGIIADRFSRFATLVIGQTCRILAIQIWLYCQNFNGFLIGAILWGASMSFLFGNMEAYIYDSLKTYGKSNVYGKLIGFFYAIQNIAISIACFYGENIYNKYSYAGIINFSSAMLIISCIMMYFSNLEIEKQKSSLIYKFEINLLRFIKMINIFKKDNKIIILFITAIIQDGLFIFFLDLNTISMTNIDNNPKSLTLLVSIVSLLRIFGSIIGSFIYNKISFMINLILLISLIIFVAIGGILYNYTLVIAITSYLVVYTIMDLTIKSQLQNKISSESRATILSALSLFSSLLAILLNLCYGLLNT
jgi:MFS family permease